jgi:hypothetical protein
MFLPLILSLTFSLPLTLRGFSLFSLVPDRPAVINLSGHTAIIFPAPRRSFNYTLNISTHEITRHSPNRPILLTGDSLSLRATKRPISLPIWVLPHSLCGSSSIILNSEHFLELTAKSHSRSNPLCFFTQPQFDEADIAVTVKSEDEQTAITFHGADTKIREQCNLAEKCRFHEDSPFFLRIQVSPNVTTALKLEYEIGAPAPGTPNCSIFAINEGGTGNIADVLEDAQFACTSKVADILEVVAFGGMGLIVLFLVFSYINVWGLADVEQQRFATLKKTPFANNLGDAHIEKSEEHL